MADIVLGPKQNIWLYYDPDREAWTSFVTGHAAGGLSGGVSAAANETITGDWTFSGDVLGIGATTQVITNQGGVLVGDAGLTYNATTNTLSIAGTAYAGDYIGAGAFGTTGHVVAFNSSGTTNIDLAGSGNSYIKGGGLHIGGNSDAGDTNLLVDGTLTVPAITTASGALTVTPAAGSGLNIALSTTGDFAINTDDFYIDTSSGAIGIGTVTPDYAADGGQVLTLSGGSGRGKMEIGTTAADADAVLTGELKFSSTSNNAVAGDQKIASILTYVQGTTANKRGGKLIFITKANNGAGTPRLKIDNLGNLSIGNDITLGTSAANVFGITNGTEPSTSPADMVQLYSTDLSAGNATLGLRTETAVVTETVTSDRTLSVRINGTTYKLCLKV